MSDWRDDVAYDLGITVSELMARGRDLCNLRRAFYVGLREAALEPGSTVYQRSRALRFGLVTHEELMGVLR